MDIPWRIRTAERARRSFWSMEPCVTIGFGRSSSKHFPKNTGCSTLVSGTIFPKCGMALETIFRSPSTLMMSVHSFNDWPVHLLGHSRGGLVVIEVAKKHPDLIKVLSWRIYNQ